MEIFSWTEISVRLPGLRFRPGLQIKYFKSGTRDYTKKISARAETSARCELPRAEKSHLIPMIDSRGKMQITKTKVTNSCLDSLPISVSVRAEIFHVMETIFNSVCRIEFQPRLKFYYVINHLEKVH